MGNAISLPIVRNGAAPFVVAISGHRDLHPADIDAVKKRLFETLVMIADALPDTALDFLSALADGADQLFAAAVLRLQKSLPDPDRVHLVVALPMALEKYCLTQGGDDPAAFKLRIGPFLHAAACVYTVPDTSIAIDGMTTENRPYVVLGRHIAIRSHLLVAVWDGQEQHALPGGTAAVVATVLQGCARRRDGDIAHWLAAPDQGHVLHVYTRTAASTLPAADRAVQGLSPAGRLAVSACIAAAGRELDQLNRRHRRALSDGGPAQTAHSNTAPSHFLHSLDIVNVASTDILAPLIQAFTIADVQAEHAKRIWRRSWIAIALAAMLAGSSSLLRLLSDTYGDLIETLSFGASAVIAISVYLWIARAGERNAYLAYRALAEGLRVQIFWLAAGSNALVSDYYLVNQRSEMGWVRKCIDSLALRSGSTSRSAALVLRCWIDDQLAYLEGPNIAGRQREQLRSAQGGHSLLLAGLGCSLTGVALSIQHGIVSNWTMVLLLIAMKLLTELGAAWISFDGKMAHAETLQQVTHLRAVYRRAALALTLIEETGDDATPLLLALGREVLEQNDNWMRVYMERRLPWYGR